MTLGLGNSKTAPNYANVKFKEILKIVTTLCNVLNNRKTAYPGKCCIRGPGISTPAE